RTCKPASHEERLDLRAAYLGHRPVPPARRAVLVDHQRADAFHRVAVRETVRHHRPLHAKAVVQAKQASSTEWTEAPLFSSLEATWLFRGRHMPDTATPG